MSNLKTRLSRIVTLPAGDENLNEELHRLSTAIYNMNPNNPGVQILAPKLFSIRVPAHSNIAVKGDGLKVEGGDGVVAYRSVHIEEAVSGLAVRRDHSCQGRTEVIEKNRRILPEHAVPVRGPHP